MAQSATVALPPAFVRVLQSRTMALLGVFFLLTIMKWGTMLFVVHQYEDAIVTRFGKAIRVETTPGLKFKLPFFDKVNRFDKRILAWDSPPTECPTKDKLYLIVDSFARWRIISPLANWCGREAWRARCAVRSDETRKLAPQAAQNPETWLRVGLANEPEFVP